MKNSIFSILSLSINKTTATFRLFTLLFLTSFLVLTSCEKSAIEDLTPESETITERIGDVATSGLNETDEAYSYPELTPELIAKANADIQQLIQEGTAPSIEAMPFSAEGKAMSAQSRSSDSFYYTIASKLAGHHVDVRGGSLANNTEIWQYTPNKTAAQIWSFFKNDDGYYYIKSKGSQKYLTVKGGSNNAKAPVVQHAYTSSLAHSQQWRLVHSNSTGYVYFINRKSGMALDVKYGSTNNKAILWQYPFNGTSAQKFKYTETTYEKPRYSKTYGGNGGGAFSLLPPGGLIKAKKISALYIRHGKYVDAIQVEWEMVDGSRIWSSRAGGAGGRGTRITLKDNEYLTKITGRSGVFVDQLTFHTSSGRKFGPHGGTGGRAFTIGSSGGIKGIYGRKGDLLDKIGMIN